MGVAVLSGPGWGGGDRTTSLPMVPRTTLRPRGEVGREMALAFGGRRAADGGVSAVCPDLQVLLPAGLPASPAGPRIPEPVVPGAAGEKLQPKDWSGF